MEISLDDRSRVPRDDEFGPAVGTAVALWEDVGRQVFAMGARSAPSWGGRAGWELRFRRAGRPFVTLTPGTDSFQACVVLGERETATAEATALPPAVRAVLDGARRYPDGTWLFIPIGSAEDVAGLVDLLEIKLPERARRAPAGVR